MISLRPTLVFMTLAALLSTAVQAEPTPSFDHTAACVAVLKPKAAVLADRYRDGDDSVKAELINLAEISFALVGGAYEAGLRAEEAELLLASAAEFQKTVPSKKLASLFTLCIGEGDAIMADSDAGGRAQITSDATARVNRIRTETRPATTTAIR